MKRYMLGVFYCSFLIAGNSVLLGAPDCPIIGRNKLAEFQAALAIADDITIDKKKKTLRKRFEYEHRTWFMEPSLWENFLDDTSTLEKVDFKREVPHTKRIRCYYEQTRTRSKGKGGKGGIVLPFYMSEMSQ